MGNNWSQETAISKVTPSEKSKARKRHTHKFLVNYSGKLWCSADTFNVSKSANGVVSEVTWKTFDNYKYKFSSADARGGRVSLAGVDNW